MPVIQSVGQLADLDPGYPMALLRTGVQLYDRFFYDYATLYRTQPNVRTCVDFLARNIAQLALHVFRRVSNTDRVRLIDHPLAELLDQPMPVDFKVTEYRLIEALMGDLGVYYNAYWLKIGLEDDGQGPQALMRVPPQYVQVKGNTFITGYVINVGGRQVPCPPEGIVHMRGYNPESGATGMSPLETLRRVLAEEQATGEYREYFWKNAARQSGIIQRPAGASVWSDPARARFKAEFEALYSGGPNSGKTAILEEGMEWKDGSFSPQESEYLAGRKLTREECARAFHIPLPMVGILDHATFSNITEQHKNLYQDSLGPWLEMIEQDIELQLLTDYSDRTGVYVEFNIAQKMAGSFEEQSKSLQTAVGRPWMTANEARARQNLPRLGGDADQLVTPLNVMVGGMASPTDADPEKALGTLQTVLADMLAKAMRGAQLAVTGPLARQPWAERETGRKAIDPTRPRLRARYQEQWRRLLVRTFTRQWASVEGKLGGSAIPDIAALWDGERWDREVAEDFLKLGSATASEWAQLVAVELDFEFDDARMMPWLEENARIGAQYVNATTQREIEAATLDEKPKAAIARVFELAVALRAVEFSVARVTTLANFGTQDAATSSGMRTKTWQVNSGNPRPEHAALDGVTVGIRETFPNGLSWPGDPRGSADDNAGCQCSVVFGR